MILIINNNTYTYKICCSSRYNVNEWSYYVYLKEMSKHFFIKTSPKSNYMLKIDYVYQKSI